MAAHPTPAPPAPYPRGFMRPLPARVRVLLAEPESMRRTGIAVTLEMAGYAVRAVGGERAALAALRIEGADLLATSLRLEDGDGLELIASARLLSPDLPCLLLSPGVGEWELYRAMCAGAAGILGVAGKASDLAVTVERALLGELCAESPVAERGAPPPILRPVSPFNPRTEAARVCPLSERELEVVALIGQGTGNVAIGRRLKISEQTVKNHITHVLHKLGCYDRSHVVTYCVERGWVYDLTWGED